MFRLDTSTIRTMALGTLLMGGCLALPVLAQDLPGPFDPTDTSTFFDTNANGTYEMGIDVPYSAQNDDFFAYPIYLLDKYFPTEGWDTSAGTGTLDVIITTRSSGQSNSDGGLAPYSIPDPITNPNTNPVTDEWGYGGTPATNMLVDDLYQYLFDTFGANIPVFTFDQNETGGNPDLNVTAVAEIIDPSDDSVVDFWAFDDLLNSVYDPTEYVLAEGETCAPDGVQLVVNADDCFDSNVGSGAFDYVIFAPTMNLSSYLGQGYVFRASWDFQDVDDGGEEITLTGRFAPNGRTPVPAPGTLMLMGVALLLLVLYERTMRSDRRARRA